MIRITKIRCNLFEEMCYVVWAGKVCAIIDPGMDRQEEFDALEKTLKDCGAVPSAILLTHAHPDHCYGAHRLAERYGINIYVDKEEKFTIEASPAMCALFGHDEVEDFSSRIEWIGDSNSIFISENGVEVVGGETAKAPAQDGQDITETKLVNIQEGQGIAKEKSSPVSKRQGIEFKAIATPGHTKGGVCYLCREFRDVEDSWKVLFSGDTLFAGSIGRSDLPGGDYDQLIKSIFSKLLVLEGSIDILPGHGPSSTISDERLKNPFLQPFNEPYEEDKE